MLGTVFYRIFPLPTLYRVTRRLLLASEVTDREHVEWEMITEQASNHSRGRRESEIEFHP